jgi:hypothetical protein
MDENLPGPLTFRQWLFWSVAIAVLVADLLILIAAAWPTGQCGCGG